MTRKRPRRGVKQFAIAAAIATVSVGVWGDLRTGSRAEGTGCTLYCGMDEVGCDSSTPTHKAFDFEPKIAGGPPHTDCRYGTCAPEWDHGCAPDPIDAVSAAVTTRDVGRLAAMVANNTVRVNEQRAAIQVIGRCARSVVAHFKVDHDLLASLAANQH